MLLVTDIKNAGNVSFCVRVGHYDSEQHPVTVTVSENKTIFSLEGHEAFVQGDKDSIPLAIASKFFSHDGKTTNTIDLFSEPQIGLKKIHDGPASNGICRDIEVMMERLDETRAILSEINDLTSFFDTKKDNIISRMDNILAEMADFSHYNVNKLDSRSAFRMMMLVAGTKIDNMSPALFFVTYGYFDKYNRKDQGKPFIVSMIEYLSRLTDADIENMSKEQGFTCRTLLSMFSAMFARYPVFFERFVANGSVSHFNSVTGYLAANPEIDHKSMAMIVMSEIYRDWFENY